MLTPVTMVTCDAYLDQCNNNTEESWLIQGWCSKDTSTGSWWNDWRFRKFNAAWHTGIDSM